MADAGERVPTDVAADDLVRLYGAGMTRLEALTRAALARGLDPTRIGTVHQQRGDATAAYRARNLEAARATLASLLRSGETLGNAAVTRAYASAVVAVDRMAIAAGVADSFVAGRFGQIHQAAVERIAANMNRSLDRAAATAQTNLLKVFARADALDGALPTSGALADIGLIGRRVDDPFRRAALETVGSGLIAGDTRRTLSRRLVGRLQREGLADAMTGFVDRAGRRWNLATYAEMVARTTTREATSLATANRLQEHGLELVQITSHPHAADECTPYDGRTFALPGTAAAEAGTYPILDVRPPFHPRCRHVMAPAIGSFDQYLDELERAVGSAELPLEADPRSSRAAPTAPRNPRSTVGRRVTTTYYRELPSPPGPRPDVAELLEGPTAEPPFGGYHARPATPDELASFERLAAQREAYAIAGDPGPELGRLDALEAEARSDIRARNRALNTTLGPDLAKFIDNAAGKRAGIRRMLLEGELTVEQATEWAEDEWNDRYRRREAREAAKAERANALRTRSFNCFICGRFKRRPADVCDYCGDTPGTVDTGAALNDYRSSLEDFNRGYGYAF